MSKVANLRFGLGLAASLAAACFSMPLAAETAATPYWASLRVDEVNMHVGPAEEYRIAWVYQRKDLPLKVIRLKDGWRLVQDPAGSQGWLLARFLTRERTAIVQGNGAVEMREKGDAAARLMWRLAPGVTGKLGECANGWCRLDAGGRIGYVLQNRLWGAGQP